MPTSLVRSFSKRSGVSVSRVERLWKKAKLISSEKFTPDTDEFYAYTVGILKKMLKIREAYLRRGTLRESDRRFLVRSDRVVRSLSSSFQGKRETRENRSSELSSLLRFLELRGE